MSQNIKQIDTKETLQGPKNIMQSQNAYLAASLRSSINSDISENKGMGKKLTVGLIVLAILITGGMLFKRTLSESSTEQSNPSKSSTLAKEKPKSNTKPQPEVATKEAINTKQLEETKLPVDIRLATNKLAAKLSLYESTDTNSDSDLLESLAKISSINSASKGKKTSDVDYYNRLTIQDSGKNDLQNSINQLMGTNDAKQSEYTAKLDKEADVRQNEVRSITLQNGDTLWSLAKRAYGDGLLYKKILSANPQITEENARKLKIGTLIRVPM